jgi:hypothetical protein
MNWAWRLRGALDRLSGELVYDMDAAILTCCNQEMLLIFGECCWRIERPGVSSFMLR